MKRILFYSLWLLVSVFFLMELAQRTLHPFGIWYFSEARRYFENMQPNPDFAYIHRPGYQDTLQGVEVRINSHGLRSPEISLQKPAGKRRIMILGDSVVFGWGVPQHQILSAQLQQILPDPTPWEVIGAGVGSWNTRTEFEFLKSRGIQFDIDALILLVVSNDLAPHRRGRTDIDKNRLFPKESGAEGPAPWAPEWLKETVKNSYFLMTLQWLWKKKWSTQKTGDLAHPTTPQWLDTKMALDGIVELTRRNQIPLQVYFSGQDTEDYMKRFRSLYKGTLEEHGIPHFDFPASLHAPSIRNSIVDGHPNATGHQIMAETLLKNLRPLLEKSGTPSAPPS